MDTLVKVLGSAAKGGWKTSEFWLTALAVVLPYAAPAAAQVPGTAGIVAQVAVAAAGAAAAGVYANSRAKVKAATITGTLAATDTVTLETASTFADGRALNDYGETPAEEAKRRAVMDRMANDPRLRGQR